MLWWLMAGAEGITATARSAKDAKEASAAPIAQARERAEALVKLQELIRQAEALGGEEVYQDKTRLYTQILSLENALLGEENPASISTLYRLGVLYQKAGDYAKAEDAYIRVIIKREKVLGPTHNDTALALGALSDLYISRHKPNSGEVKCASLSPFEYARGVFVHIQGREWVEKRDADIESRFSAVNEGDGFIELHDQDRDLLVRLYCSTAFWFNKTDKAWYRWFGSSRTNRLLIVSAMLSGQHQEEGLHYLKVFLGAQAKAIVEEVPLLPVGQRLRFVNSLGLLWQLPFFYAERWKILVQTALETRLNRQGLLAEIERRQRQLAASSPETRDRAEQIASIDRQLASVSLPPERREALEGQRKQLEEELYLALPDLRIKPVSTEQVAAALKALAPKGLLVEFQKYRPYQGIEKGKEQWGEARYVALLLRPDGAITSVPLPQKASTIDAAIAAALNATADNNADAEELLAQLSRLVLMPLEPHLAGIQELFLSPDGELSRVPFSALPAPAGSGRLLGEAFQLRLLTTGRDLVRLHEEPAAPARPSVVLANPEYGRSTAGSSPVSPSQPSTYQRCGGLPGSQPCKPLPDTAEEAKQLAQLLPMQPPITGTDATVARALQQKGPRIFHIATHGFFEPDLPQRPAATKPKAGTPLAGAMARQQDPLQRSGLVLAGANLPQADPAHDDYLTAAEATGMDLKGTELVTLSACETGLGDVRSGEGVYGLQRALTVAGARSTLLSLWSVDSKATAAFMEAYYTRLKAGEGRAAALAGTQAAFRNHPTIRYRDVYVWGAFQLSGDWRPIQGL
jgi:CHAT domain-containing protein